MKTPKERSILDAELLWFFRNAHAEMGVHAQAISQQWGGNGIPETTLSDRVIEATTRHRKIASALAVMPNETLLRLKVLHAFPPAHLKKVGWRFGELLPLAVMMEPDLETILRLSWHDEIKDGRKAAKRIAKSCASVAALAKETVKTWRNHWRETVWA